MAIMLNRDQLEIVNPVTQSMFKKVKFPMSFDFIRLNVKNFCFF